MLAVIVFCAYLVRFTCWIRPGYCLQNLSIYDVGLISSFGVSYVEGIRAGNLTAVASVHPGVPPLGMILTGLSITTLGPYIGQMEAGLLVPITFSTATIITIYLILRRYSSRAALIASALMAFDPYLIQYSTTYLDAPGTFFMAAATYYILGQDRRGWFWKAALLGGLASLTKLTYLIFTAALIFLAVYSRTLPPKKGAVILTASASAVLLSPWLWTPQTIEKTVEHHTLLNNVPLSSIIGPFVIGVPQSLPWYILSYLGMGQVFWNTLPFITPLVTLAIILYRALQGRLHIPATLAVAASASALTIFLLPRNYWTANWSGMLQGVLARQFYPYYFYPVGPFFAILTGALLAQQNDRTETTCSRLITYPVLLASVLSPFALVMNLAFPYWDFLFTLIYNLSLGRWVAEGITATSVTAAMLVFAVTFSELMHRRVFCSK
jgi:4-amino-4-deoxy-L-arabinose transferase-like glycosyltransferase